MTDPAGHEGDLSYHQRMVSDAQRMVAYERAIRAVVKPGDVVLDVGAGTGVLSLFAARAGARVVHAVESMGIGEVVPGLAIQNGVADRVKLHRADIRELPVFEPVDVIVSDCLGRFLVDDFMLEAMAAAAKWLRPGGTIIPARVDLFVAPIELQHFGVVDTWLRPVLGLDLSPLSRFADAQTYPISTEPYQLLAPPRLLTTWTPPQAMPAFDKSLDFDVARGGRLRGLLGWFRAQLAPGVDLITEPGVETHWQQLLFPVPATAVHEGDHLAAAIRPRPAEGGESAGWRWSLEIDKRSEEFVTSQHVDGADGGLLVDALRSSWPADIDVVAAHERAEAAWEAGDHEVATRGFELVSTYLDARDPDAAATWENIGIGYHTLRLFTLAITPLMRALDCAWTSREQSLRLLTDACFRSGRTHEGATWLALYEATFGPHPAGWRNGISRGDAPGT